MWTVTTRFLNSIPVPHVVATRVTVTLPGGSPIPLTLVAGNVTASGSQKIRRTANLTINGGSATYDLLSTPGARVAVTHGLEYLFSDPELVPVITGELSGAAQTLGDGDIVITVADLWQRLAACEFSRAYSPSPTTTRAAEIANRVTAVVPGTTVVDTSTGSGTVGTTDAWDSREALLTQLATDGSLEIFFNPDGSFRIRNEAQVTDAPVWVVKPGEGGNLKTLARNRPLDKLYNTVVVTPSSLNNAQTWPVQTVSITDTSHPRHSSKIGVRPYRWEARSNMSAASALTAATTLLNRTLGTTESLHLGTLSNPALEPGDVLTIVNIVDGGAYQTITHLIDGFSLDLITGDMTIDTRSSTEVV